MKPIIYYTICFLLIALFTYTAVSKWMNMSLTLYEMRNQPFSRAISDILAYILPPIEAVVALLIILEKTRLAGLYIAVFLMALFTAYVLIILLGFFNRVPCSCGGIISSLGWKGHLWLNLFFLFSSIMGIHLYKKIHA
ncbi:MAG: hypothetical protein K2X37_09035 [Chitinophagaceae bacterium]|nr:hypothetical protein [Chitinophagaceae bacterium]